MAESTAILAEAEAARQIAESPKPARRAGGWSARMRKISLGRVAMHIFLILGVIVMVGPLVWMVLTSLKTSACSLASSS
mgnify:CR=1 FL=1